MPQTSKQVTGPPAQLVSRINHLSRLLENLPEHLPKDPVGTSYDFYVDADLLKVEGLWYAVNHRLEVCFRRHEARNGHLIIEERSSRFPALIDMLKEAVKKCPAEREMIHDIWVERLIRSAEEAGGKVPR